MCWSREPVAYATGKHCVGPPALSLDCAGPWGHVLELSRSLSLNRWQQSSVLHGCKAQRAFLIQLVQLAGTNDQIDTFRGASPLTAAQIRVRINALETTGGDVDEDGDFDGNDAFLIQLVQLAGTNDQIDTFRGASTLSAAQIRANINALGGNSTTSGSSDGAVAFQLSGSSTVSPPPDAKTDENLFQSPEAGRRLVATADSAEELPAVDQVWTAERNWLDLF